VKSRAGSPHLCFPLGHQMLLHTKPEEEAAGSRTSFSVSSLDVQELQVYRWEQKSEMGIQGPPFP